MKVQNTLNYTTPQLQKLVNFLYTYENEQEIWKEIDGYNGQYFVSNYGNVLSLKYKQARLLKPQDTGKGYLYVDLEGKQKTIHRLVAFAFLPNIDNKPVVHHKDGNKHNNKLENLQFATYSENTLYYQEAKRKQEAQ